MRGILPKSLLALTSFAPLLCIIAINHFVSEQTLEATDLSNDEKTLWMILVLDMAICLIFACWGIMKKASKKGATSILEIQEFNRRDQGILVFMFIYLLPLIRSPDSLFTNWQTTIGTLIVFTFIIVIINDIGAYNFNPVMRIFGYRVYEVKDTDNVRHLLITRKILQRPCVETIRVREISHDVYVHAEGDNAQKIADWGNY